MAEASAGSGPQSGEADELKGSRELVRRFRDRLARTQKMLRRYR